MHDLFRELHEAQKKLIKNQSLKDPKKPLHIISKFFISHTWNEIEPLLMSSKNYGLTLPDDLNSYLVELNKRNPAFPWAWFRSRCTEVLIEHLERVLPKILENNPKEANTYLKSLKKAGFYWFRQTPLHHLKLGYHTAISALWKMWGGGVELCLKHNVEWNEKMHEQFFNYAKQTASFHLEMLTAVDGVLWDGAGATSIPASSFENGVPEISKEQIEMILSGFPKNPGQLSEGRFGCPALTSKATRTKSIFDGVAFWIEKIFREIYLPAIKSGKV